MTNSSAVDNGAASPSATRHAENDRIDPWIKDALRSSCDLPIMFPIPGGSIGSWLLVELGPADELSNFVDPDPSLERAFAVDPNMRSSLGAVGCLPTSPGFDLDQEKESTIHPNTTGGLGATGIPA
jgi:hypothetical protein